MIKTQFYCDPCGARLSEQEYTALLLKAHEFGTLQPGAAWVVQEIMCPRCIEHAFDFWKSKCELEVKIAGERATRLERHRKDFFTERVNRSRPRAVAKPKAEAEVAVQ
mgnify:FL=1